MEKFFTPTRRYQELFEHDSNGYDGLFEYTEVELAVPVEEFLVHFLDWKGLWAFLTGGRRILWITKDAFLVVKENGNVFQFHDDGPGCFIEANFRGTSGQEQTLILACDDGSIVEADVFWRVITTSNSIEVTIQGNDENDLELPSGPILSRFLQESLSLQVLEFNFILFREEHCRALATLQRTDLKIKLIYCTIEPEDAKDAFIEWFRHNQVVTELNSCYMDSSILCALSGNKSIKKLSMERHPSAFADDEEIRSLAQALPGNMGIEHLTLCDFHFSIETWSLLVSSLATHPRIKILSLCDLWNRSADHIRSNVVTRFSSWYTMADTWSTMADTILQMLHLNTVVLAIEIPDNFRALQLYRNSILPRLEMNRTCFEVQRQAVKRADLSVRPQLLGRALHVVRYNPNLPFQFLSENVSAFVRIEEEDSAIPLENDPAIVSGQKRKEPS
jgi:hypothetical protein